MHKEAQIIARNRMLDKPLPFRHGIYFIYKKYEVNAQFIAILQCPAGSSVTESLIRELLSGIHPKVVH